MGVFDYVRCEYPLPGLDDPTSIRFQTKDTEEMWLHQYTITKDGRLVSDVIHYEDRSDPKAEPGPSTSLKGRKMSVKTGEKHCNYHGILRFYGYAGDVRGIGMPENLGQDEAHPEEAEWFEFEAAFTHGKLVEVKRVRP